MLRVLNVVHSLEHGGGIEAFLFNVFRTLQNRELELHVCFVGPTAGSLATEVEQMGVKVWGCRTSRDPFSFMKRLRRKLVEHGPFDAIHSHLGNFSGPALKAARRAGVPIRAAHYHCLKVAHRNDWLRRTYERVMRRWVSQDATAIVGCSQAALEAFYPKTWRSDPRMRVVSNGVPLSDFRQIAPDAAGRVRDEFGIPANATLIGHVGRFVQQKNHTRLVEVAARIIAQRPETHFLFVGEGVLRAGIEAKVATLGVSANVHFAGLRRDIPELVSAMDVVTLPSLAEGFGIALIEAQAAGKPVLGATNRAAIEAVAPVFRDYLRDPHDVPAMTEALLALVDRSRVDASFADAARSYAARFSIEASCESLVDTWRAAPARAANTRHLGLRDLLSWIRHVLVPRPAAAHASVA